MSALPPGYFAYNTTTAIHMSVVRRFSADPERFLKVLPDINGDPDRHDREDFIDTLTESAGLDLALVEFLKAGTGFEGLPPPLFVQEAA